MACWLGGQNTFSYGPSFNCESASWMLSGYLENSVTKRKNMKRMGRKEERTEEKETEALILSSTYARLS